MRKYNIPPAFSGSLQLGRQGENGVTEITFLCAGYAKMYGDGFAEAVHRTPDGTTYPVNIEQDENNRVSWLISDGDTATAGTGQLELRWMVNGNLAKSKIFSTIIKSALTAPETPPDAAKSWVDKVLKAAEDIKASGVTEQKAREIAQSVVDAYQESDPTVPDWAKAETKPTYTSTEVGAVPDSAKSDIDKNTSARHTHGNKSALDSISESDIAKWNSGTAGTVEITGATGLAAGSAPTVTETADSTAQARKYMLGIPAGENGTDGKSAYQFAQEAGYTGTEADFSKKLNQTTFANPFPITFTGAASATYDGSSAVTVDLPSGGSSQDVEAIKQDVVEIKADLSNKITKFYASNLGEINITDSDDGKVQDMMLYGKSEQTQYKGVNLLPSNWKYLDEIEVSIATGVSVFWASDGAPAKGGNFKFFNADKSKSQWLGVEAGETSQKVTLRIDAKYVQPLISAAQRVNICLGVGATPVYEPYTGGQPSPSLEYPQKIKSVVNPTVKVTNEDESKAQSVTLNDITLNAIPVSSDGNVTINGQQYVADYVDVERGKFIRMVDPTKLDNTQSIVNKTEWLLAAPQEIDLMQEEVQTLKAFVTYYPTTNIGVNSEQLDGYTVFNYPISLQNGWNYVKKQLDDNRDYIYDMDTQSAEAYVNSEYAVALTELEV